MSKKKKDIVSFTMDNMSMNMGIAAGAGIIGKLPCTPVSGNIMKGMGVMSMLPTVHAASGVFSQLNDIGRLVKKKKR